ncbi:hypothetical protein T10_13377, partial [Trichinella papuae]
CISRDQHKLIHKRRCFTLKRTNHFLFKSNLTTKTTTLVNRSKRNIGKIKDKILFQCCNAENRPAKSEKYFDANKN